MPPTLYVHILVIVGNDAQTQLGWAYIRAVLVLPAATTTGTYIMIRTSF
jgi:hypothetical protein